MIEKEGAKCGWCLTNRCPECLPSGDGWECHCTHGELVDSYHKQGQLDEALEHGDITPEEWEKANND